MTLKHETIFGQSKGTTFMVFTLNLEFSGTCPKKNHSQYHCDMWTWSGAQIRPWMYCWKAEKMFIGMLMATGIYRNLGTGLMQFTNGNWKISRRIYMVRRALTNSQATSRPDHLWPEMWSGMSEAVQGREKQQWASEKPKLDNACKSRGIDFIDPVDIEFKESNKCAEKVGIPKWNQPCLVRSRTTSASRHSRITGCMHRGSSWVYEKAFGRALPEDHEDRIAGNWFNSSGHHNLAHKFTPMPRAMKIPDAKAPVDKEWKKLEQLSAWQVTKVKSRREVVKEAQKEQRTVHFATLIDISHLKKIRSWNTNSKNTKVVLCSEVTVWKTFLALIQYLQRRGSSTSQVTAATEMDAMVRPPDCAGQAADAVRAYTQVKKWRMLQNCS